MEPLEPHILPAAEPITVHTIGHSNHAPERLLALLTAREIDVVADVRSTPFSRHVPHAGRPALERLLRSAGICYAWMGEGLGGMPKDAALLAPDGHPDFARIAASPAFAHALELVLESAGEDFRLCLLCAEEDPARCHRRRLIAPALRARGVRVLHIRGDGAVVDDADMDRAQRAAPTAPPTPDDTDAPRGAVQLSLFS